MNLKELRAKLGQLADAMTAIQSKADDEGRDLSDAEVAQFEKHEAEVQDVKDRIAKLEGDQRRREAARNLEMGNMRGGDGVRFYRDVQSGKAIAVLSNKARFAELPRYSSRDLPADALGEFICAKVTGRWDRYPAVGFAQSEGVNTAGGFLVPDGLWGQYIDLSRVPSTAIAAGAQTLMFDTETLRLGRITADPAMEVKGENASFSGNDIEFDSILLTSRTHGQVVTASREWFEDCPNAAEIVTNTLARAQGAALDRLIYQGDGGADGMLTPFQGAQSQAISVGGAVDWGHLLDAIEDVRDNNGEPNAYVTTPGIRTDLSKLVINSETLHYAPAPDDVAALQRFTSNNVAAGELLLGDFRQIIVGIRSQARIELSTQADQAFDRHQVKVKLTWRGDLNAFHGNQLVRLHAIT
jgi:HK97 family phage major capsid protein